MRWERISDGLRLLRAGLFVYVLLMALGVGGAMLAEHKPLALIPYVPLAIVLFPLGFIAAFVIFGRAKPADPEAWPRELRRLEEAGLIQH
jgi:hypothetical protein